MFYSFYLCIYMYLKLSSHMEVECPRTWGTGTADPKPKQPEHLRARPTCNPAMSPAPTPAPVTLNWKNSGKTY